MLNYRGFIVLLKLFDASLKLVNELKHAISILKEKYIFLKFYPFMVQRKSYIFLL